MSQHNPTTITTSTTNAVTTSNRTILGTCEFVVCVRIESQIHSGVKMRIRVESSIQIFSTPTNVNY